MKRGYSISDKSPVFTYLVALGGLASGCADLSDPEPTDTEVEQDLTAATVALGETEPYGDPFIANTFTVGDQRPYSVSSCGNGDSVLVWWDNARGSSLFTRLYSAAGIPLQRDARLVDPVGTPVGGLGCFATSFYAPDGSEGGVFVTIYDRLGNVVVPQFRVNEVTAGDQNSLVVAVNARGQFAVAWQEPSTKTIYAKLFQANGVAVAPAQIVFRSNEIPFAPRIAINRLGAFVVTWTVGLTPRGELVYARPYGATGFSSTAAFRVNESTTGFQGFQAPAISPAGDFVITWLRTTSTSTELFSSVFGRRFNAIGNALTREFEISTGPGLGSFDASVAMAASGDFIVTWSDFSSLTAPGQVMARSYRSNGTPLAPSFVVSTNSSVSNGIPQVIMDADGNATIAWMPFDVATHSGDVAVRRYRPGGITVQPMADGATITNLSGSAGSWQYFKVTVPSGHSIVDVFISGSVGDADLYLRHGAVPSATAWDGRPFLDGSNEGAEMLGFPPGDWYIGINGFTAYASLSLQVSSR